MRVLGLHEKEMALDVALRNKGDFLEEGVRFEEG